MKKQYYFMFLFLGCMVMSVFCFILNVLNIYEAFIEAIELGYTFDVYKIITIVANDFYHYWLPSLLLFIICLMNFLVIYKKGSLKMGWNELISDIEYKEEDKDL